MIQAIEHWAMLLSGEFLILSESLSWISYGKQWINFLMNWIKIWNSMKSRPVLRLQQNFEPHAIVKIRIVLLIDQCEVFYNVQWCTVYIYTRAENVLIAIILITDGNKQFKLNSIAHCYSIFNVHIIRCLCEWICSHFVHDFNWMPKVYQ